MYGGIKKTLCIKCNTEISNNNFNKHYTVCFGEKTKKSFDMAEHLRRIRPNNKPGFIPWNKGLTKESDERIKKYANTVSKTYQEGNANVAFRTSLDYKQKRRVVALNNKLGGYNERAGHSKKIYCTDSYGKKVCLQSTYELKCAQILDTLKVQWIRPTHIKYVINLIEKRYFPDFYLVDYDIYLDPKNNYLALKDEFKINEVIRQNSIRVVILTNDKLTEEYIKSIIKN